MVGKSKIDIFKNMGKKELEKEISNYVGNYRYYQRLIAMRLMGEGNSITKVAEMLKTSFPTIHTWAKNCEKEGLEGLKPKFGGGRPSKLSDEQFKELDKMIMERSNMTMKDVQFLIFDEFNVNYSLKQIGEITRKLDYNYSKAYPYFSKAPENADEILNDRLEEQNVNEEDILVFYDESSFLNDPYTRKSLYKQGTEHRQKVNPAKFKTNAIGALTINGNSNLTISDSSTAPEIGKSLIELRKVNVKNKKLEQLLEDILDKINLSDEEIDKIMDENGENIKVFEEKINNVFEKYSDYTTSTLARIIGKHCKRESLNNTQKRREIMRNIILDILIENNIEEKMQKEKRICVVLDNYSVHKSKFIENIAYYLNIVLIFLPPYSPHLNPIEQLWKTIKDVKKQYFIKSEKHLEELVKNAFYKAISENKFYKNWYIKFIKKVS